MRTEQEVQLGLRPDIKSHPQSNDNALAEKSISLKPTIDQLEEILEERILTDRRKIDHGNAHGTERRTYKRRR